MVMNAGLVLSRHLKQVRETFAIACNSILIILLKGDLSKLRILDELVCNETVLTSANGLTLLHSQHRVILMMSLETLNFSRVITDSRWMRCMVSLYRLL